jgi:Na+/H+-dicarboxylate symporter
VIEILRRFTSLKLHYQILIAMVLGLVFAVVFGKVAFVDRMAEIFMRLLRMVIVPLIATSIVHGVSGIGDGKSLGRLGLKTLLYYCTTSLFAILVGLSLSNLLRPGDGLEPPTGTSFETPELQAPGSLGDILVRMIPRNPIQAAAEFDILGIIFFSICFGATLGVMRGGAGERLRQLSSDAFEAMMKLTHFVIRLLPIGVFGLMARAIGDMGFGVFEQVGLYMVTVALGLTIHLVVVLPLLFWVLTRQNPLDHFRAMRGAMATAFATSSSQATLPMTMTSVEENAGVSNKVSSFVLPMGATVNMDGTALLECVGVMFIAQVLGVDLSIPQQLVVVITALLASIGAAAIPSAGLVMIFVVIEAVGLSGPAAFALVGLMLSVDRPLDMYRTVVNVTSDSVGAAVIAHSEGETLDYTNA